MGKKKIRKGARPFVVLLVGGITRTRRCAEGEMERGLGNRKRRSKKGGKGCWGSLCAPESPCALIRNTRSPPPRPVYYHRCRWFGAQHHQAYPTGCQQVGHLFSPSLAPQTDGDLLISDTPEARRLRFVSITGKTPRGKSSFGVLCAMVTVGGVQCELTGSWSSGGVWDWRGNLPVDSSAQTMSNCLKNCSSLI